MTERIVPLTPELWPAFETLFGKDGACYGCWCTYFRLSPAARRDNDRRQRNKDLMRTRIEAGPPPGLLALDDGSAMAWMQVGPRGDVPEWNNKGRGSAPLDPADALDPAMWAISCFFIHNRFRRQGLTHRMVEAGIGFARASGARALEACPMDRSKDSRSIGLFVGSTRVFERAGFEAVARRKPGRPLMRLML
jgi:predicted GNAT family acetyltransferase